MLSTYPLGATALLSLSVRDDVTPANNPVTGQTATVALRKVSDGTWFNWSTSAFGSAGTAYGSLAAAYLGALTDNNDGTYSRTWASGTYLTAAGYVQAIYEIPAGTYQCMLHETLCIGYSVTYVGGSYSIPAPADPSLCRVYCFMKYVDGTAAGTAVGSTLGTLDVVRVVSRPANSTVVYGAAGASGSTDGSGFVYVDVVRGAKVTLRATCPSADEAGTAATTTLYADITVPDSSTYDAGADLGVA